MRVSPRGTDDRAARIEAIIFILNVHNTEIIKIYYQQDHHQQDMQKTWEFGFIWYIIKIIQLLNSETMK